MNFVIVRNWSALKRSILTGSLSGPNFPIRTAKMDHLCCDVRLKEAKCFNFDKKIQSKYVLN